jgi:hypothetical protein
MRDYEIFEVVVHVIQASYNKSSIINIHRNHKIRCKIGILREFDVFVEAMINDFKINIAIECKNYKNRIKIEQIDSFETKCNSVPSISNKVYVAKNGFQSGAVKAAEMYSIDLYTLKSISEEELNSWFGIQLPRPVSITRYLRNVFLQRDGKNLFTMNPNDFEKFIFNEENPIGIQLIQYLNSKLKFKPYTYSIEPSPDSSESSTNFAQIEIDSPNSSILIKGIKYNFFKVIVIIEDTISPIKCISSLDSYQKLNAKNQTAKTATLVYESGEIRSFVKKVGEKKVEIYDLVDGKFKLYADIEVTKNLPLDNND